MPQLLTVVTELCAAALPPTGELRTAGTPEGNNCIPARGRTKKRHKAKHYTMVPAKNLNLSHMKSRYMPNVEASGSRRILL